MTDPQFYTRDARALTKSRHANVNPCEYGRICMLIDMSCEEYPLGVLEISLEALCTKWRMNALRAQRLLLKMRDEWRLIGRIEGKDGPLRIELSYGGLRQQAADMDGRGHHDPVSQVQALSEESLTIPLPRSRDERDEDADRQAWSRYQKADPAKTWGDKERAQFMAMRRADRQQKASTAPGPPVTPSEKSDVTPESSNVTPPPGPHVTPDLPAFFGDVTPVTACHTDPTTTELEENREINTNNTDVTPACHSENAVTSGSVTLEKPAVTSPKEETKEAVVVAFFASQQVWEGDAVLAAKWCDLPLAQQYAAWADKILAKKPGERGALLANLLRDRKPIPLEVTQAWQKQRRQEKAGGEAGRNNAKGFLAQGVPPDMDALRKKLPSPKE